VGRNVVGISTAEGGLVVNNVSRNNSSFGILMDCPGAAIANTTSNNLGDNFSQLGGVCDPNTTNCCVVNEHNSTI
jgi:Na+-translocating ferredoxin:NAD+ oxidoreductase RnfE subunit